LAWFGFNAGSLLKFDAQITLILLNTLISAIFGGFAAWILTFANHEKTKVELFSFGIIAGLVGITAGCHLFTIYQAAVVGFISAMIMHFSNEFISKKLKIDDPLNVIGIHGFAGAWGTLAIALFTASPTGLSFVEFFIVQTLGIFSAFIFSFTLGIILFLILYRYKFLRVKKRSEVLGLNTSEHNAKLPWVETIESI
ncbi:ammonium transporter, partial [Halarcobacter ebronensis]